MATPINEAGCPSCGNALGPYDLLCPTCGAKLKHLYSAGNLEPQQRELRAIANGALAQASTHIANAHKVGAKVDLAEDLLAMAKKAMVGGNFSVALDLASKSGEEAETLVVQYEALQGRLRQAHRAMEAAREEGVDTADCEELLGMASEASIAGDYKSALRYALKAVQRAERGRNQYTAWKVEISDWLK